MKNVYRVSTKQHGDMKSGILQSKNATILLVHCLAQTIVMWKCNYPHKQVNSIALHVFVAATVKLQIFDTNEPDFSPLKQGSNWQHILG